MRKDRLQKSLLPVQIFSCCFDNCINVARHVIACHIDDDIWLYSKFYGVHILVKHGAGRKTYGPSVGQFRAERQTSASACTRSHEQCVGAGFHICGKAVGGTVATSVGQHDDGLLPAHAFGRFQFDRLWIRKVVVSLSGLVTDVTAYDGFVCETFGQSLSCGQQTTLVVAYIYDKPVADG